MKSLFVPVKNASRKRKADETLKDILGAIKNLAEKDPMKDYIQFAREEAEKSRQHEARMIELMMNSAQPNQYQHPMAMPSPLSYGLQFQPSDQEYNLNNNNDKTFFKL